MVKEEKKKKTVTMTGETKPKKKVVFAQRDKNTFNTTRKIINSD